MKKRWLIPVSIIVVTVVVIAIGIGVMISKGLGCSVGRYLPTENGTSMLVVDNSPIVMSDRTNRNLFRNLNVGDKILVIHDGIKETYPAGTGAYAVIKLQNGSNEDIPQKVVDELTELGWYPAKVSKEDLHIYTGIGEPLYMGRVAYANWTDDEYVYESALNAEKLANRAENHLPIYKLESMEELEKFKTDYADKFSFNQSYNEIPSLNEVLSGYDETVFDKNMIFVIYVPASSGTYRYNIDGIYYDGTNFCVWVKQTNNPEIVTEDMAGWMLMLGFDKASLEGCVSFDAVMK